MRWAPVSEANIPNDKLLYLSFLLIVGANLVSGFKAKAKKGNRNFYN